MFDLKEVIRYKGMYWDKLQEGYTDRKQAYYDLVCDIESNWDELQDGGVVRKPNTAERLKYFREGRDRNYLIEITKIQDK